MRVLDAFHNAVFRNYARFSGRTHRAEFWWCFLAFIIFEAIIIFCSVLLLLFIAYLPQSRGITIGIFFWSFISLVFIVLFIPALAIQVRRLHDINMSGWWILLILIPSLGAIAMLVFMLLPSNPEGERFGPYVGSDAARGNSPAIF